MKKRWIGYLLVLSFVIALFAGCASGRPAFTPLDDTKANTPADTEAGKVDDKQEDIFKTPIINITPSETSQIEYEEYDNGLVSFDIPEGWEVDVPSFGYASYSFKVYDPDHEDYMFFFCLKVTGFLKSEDARAAFASMYPDAAFGKLAAIDPQTTEAFYKVWTQNAKLSNDESVGYDYFPYLDNFTVVENLGQFPLGGDILRATFTNASGDLMQGLFTASIYDAGSYYMYGYDFAPLSSYHNVMMTAPDDDFNNWQPIMDHCLGTVQFSEEFMDGFRREEEIMVSTVQANAKIYDEISDMIMDSWEMRNNSYDIISQKQSDATLGYERVYDTETGDVYRAYNGFTDDYSGDRYQSITDDMYTEVISGYIER